MRGWRRTAGVAPEVLYFDADGVMLTRFLDAEPLLPDRIAGMTIAPSSVPPGRFAGCTSRRIGFEGEFRPFESIDCLCRGAGSLRRAAIGVSERAIDRAD